MPLRSSTSVKPSTRTDPEGPPDPGVPGSLRDPVGPAPRRLGGLVLARRQDQVIVIGRDVELKVVSLRANAVRLMFTAPVSTPIHRREVFDAIPPARSAGDPVPREELTPPGAKGKLVLTRRVGESVMIGDEIRVEVADLRGGTARFRVTAPREVAVDRREIRDAIRRGGSPPGDQVGADPA